MGEISGLFVGLLTEEEISSIPDHVRKKIETSVRTLSQELSSNVALLTALKHDHEQRVNELEEELSLQQQKYFSLKNEVSNITCERDDMQLKLQASQDEILTLQKKIDECEKQFQNYKLEHDAALNERDKLQLQLEHKSYESDLRQSEVNSVMVKLEAAREELNSSLFQSRYLESKKKQLDEREKDFETEREALVNQVSSLRQDLKLRNEQNSSLESKFWIKASEYDAKISHKNEELQIVQEANNELNSVIQKLKEQLEITKRDLQQETEKREALEEKHLQEMLAQKKIIAGFEGLKENELRITGVLEEKLMSLRQELEDEKQKNKSLVGKLKELKKVCEDMDKKLNSEKCKLTEELEVANRVILKTLEDQLEQDTIDLFPVIASAYRLLKPGTRYTQICQDQFKMLAEMEKLQKQNDLLNEYLDSIVKELEERAVSMINQRKEFEEALRQNEFFEMNCKKLMKEVVVLRQQVAESRKANYCVNDWGQEAEHLNSEIDSNEVDMRLGERSPNMEDDYILNYILSRPKFQSLDNSSNDNRQRTSLFGRNMSSGVHSEEQFSALGSSNPLLSRILTGEQCTFTSSLDGNISTIYRRLNQFSEELKGNKLMKVRDTSTQTDPVAPDDAVVKLQEDVIGKEVTIQELQSKLGQEVHLRQQLEEIRTHAATMAAQLHVAQEGLKVLQANATTYKTKLVETDKKNRNYSVTMTKQEHLIQQMKHTVEDLEGRLQQANAQLINLQHENQSLRVVESRTAALQDMLHQERQTKEALFSRLEQIHSSIEKPETEGMLYLRQSLANSVAESADLKIKLQKLDADTSSKLKTLQNSLEKARNENMPLRQQIELLERQLVERDERLEELSQVITKRPADTRPALETETKPNYVNRLLKERELELSDCKVSLETTQHLLNKSRQHAVFYKDTSLKLEKDLEKLMEEYKIYKEESRKREEESLSNQNSLQQQIQQLKQDLELARTFEVKLQECQHELTSCQSDLLELRTDLEEEHSQKIAAKVKYSEILIKHSENESALITLKEKIQSLEKEIEVVKVAKEKAEVLLENQNERWQDMAECWKKEQQKMMELLNTGLNKNMMLYKQLNEVSSKAMSHALSETVNSLKRKRPEDSDSETGDIARKDEDTAELPEVAEGETSPPNKKMLISNVRSISPEDADFSASDTKVRHDGEQLLESEELQQVYTRFEKFRSIINSLHVEKMAVYERAQMLELEADSLRSRTEKQEELLNAGQQALSQKQDKLEEEIMVLSKQSSLLKDETLSSVTEANLRLFEERSDLEKQNKVMREHSAVLETRVAEINKTELELEKKKVRELQNKVLELERLHKQTMQTSTVEKKVLLREKEVLRRAKRRKTQEIRELRKQLKLSLRSSYKLDDSRDQDVSGECEADEYAHDHDHDPAYPYEGNTVQQPQEGASEDEVCLVDIADEEDSVAQSTEGAEYQEQEYTAENAAEYPDVEDPDYQEPVEDAQYEEQPEDSQYQDGGDESHFRDPHDAQYHDDVDDPEYHHPNGEGEFANTDGHTGYHCVDDQEFGDEEPEEAYSYEDEEYQETEEPGEILHRRGLSRVESNVRHRRAVPSEEEMEEEDDEPEDNVVTVLDSEDAECEDSTANENLQRLLRSGNISLVHRKERPVNSDVSGVGRKLAETSSDEEMRPGRDKVGHAITRRQGSGTAKRARSWRSQRSSAADSGS